MFVLFFSGYFIVSFYIIFNAVSCLDLLVHRLNID